MVPKEKRGNGLLGVKTMGQINFPVSEQPLPQLPRPWVITTPGTREEAISLTSKEEAASNSVLGPVCAVSGFRRQLQDEHESAKR